MPALQTNSKTMMMPVVPDDVFNQPLLMPLVYKSIQLVYERKLKGQKASKTRNQFSSMGLVIPFHPCMWDDKTIDLNLNNAIQMVQKKMKDKYSEVFIAKILSRLKTLFLGLNFNTHRKSLAVILTHDEENIIYLSFPVRPTVFFSRSVSWLNLAANIQREPDFYYLVLNKDYRTLYDFNNKQLRKVHEHKNEPCPEKLFKKVVAVLGLLNCKYEKPVFVTGNPNLVEQFCKSENYAENYFSLLHYKAPVSSEIFQPLIKEITGHWSYWRSKFIAGSVLLAQKTNGLISHTEAVLQALQRGADGLLVIDKRLKHQLQKPVCGNIIIQMEDDLISLIEKFLSRGNRFEITEPGLLKDFGGIVLLSNTSPVISGVQVCQKRNEASSKGELF